MSLASDYAQAVNALQVPAPFDIPRMRAEVKDDGECQITVDGSMTFIAPAVGLLAFAAWINATFGD